tara:strand:+ start:263 stop:439 length:177 start_codon:yes stop_codon:yes gene_type:complete
MGMYDTQVLINSARGLSVVLRDIASTSEGDNSSDLEFVASRLEVLLAELEQRMRVYDE